MLEPDLLYDDGSVIAELGGGVRLQHINGCLHRFFFSAEFTGITSGGTITIELQSSDWTASKTDVMPNW